MKKIWINYWTDIGLLLLFIIIFVTGLIKFPGFLKFFGVSLRQLPMDEIMWIHDWSGVLMMILVVLHTFLHWKWLIETTKKLIRSR